MSLFSLPPNILGEQVVVMHFLGGLIGPFAPAGGLLKMLLSMGTDGGVEPTALG